MSEEIKKIKDKLEIIIRNDFDYLLRTHDCKILLDYITNLQQKVEQLENIIDVKKYDYDYLETLFSKSSKEEVLKAYTYKCEQLEKVTETRNKFQMKSMQLENIRKEIKEYIEKHVVCCKSGDMLVELKVDDLLNILNKGSDK